MYPFNLLSRPARRLLLFSSVFVFVNLCIYLTSPRTPEEVRDRFYKRGGGRMKIEDYHTHDAESDTDFTTSSTLQNGSFSHEDDEDEGEPEKSFMEFPDT